MYYYDFRWVALMTRGPRLQCAERRRLCARCSGAVRVNRWCWSLMLGCRAFLPVQRIHQCCCSCSHRCKSKMHCRNCMMSSAATTCPPLCSSRKELNQNIVFHSQNDKFSKIPQSVNPREGVTLSPSQRKSIWAVAYIHQQMSPPFTVSVKTLTCFEEGW